MKILKYTFDDRAFVSKFDKNIPYVVKKLIKYLNDNIDNVRVEHFGSTAIGCPEKILLIL